MKIMANSFLKKENESNFEYQLRLCNLKVNKETNLSWQDIIDLLHLPITVSTLRHKAYAFKEYENYLNQKDIVKTKILAISDLHIPFQLPVETFNEYKNNIDILVINGDINDFQAISKFPKVYRLSPMEEMIVARKYLIELINYIHPQKVIINKGNHDQRFQNYLAKNLDSDLLELMPETQLDLICNEGFNHYNKYEQTKIWYTPLVECFKDTDVEVVYTKDWKCKIGQTWFAHPLSYSNSTLKTVENAMNYFNKNDTVGFDTVVLGHTHQIGFTKKGNVCLYEQGACCDVGKLNYTDGKLTNPQKQGFLYLCQDDNGSIIESKTKLICLN